MSLRKVNWETIKPGDRFRFEVFKPDHVFEFTSKLGDIAVTNRITDISDNSWYLCTNEMVAYLERDILFTEEM